MTKLEQIQHLARNIAELMRCVQVRDSKVRKLESDVANLAARLSDADSENAALLTERDLSAKAIKKARLAITNQQERKNFDELYRIGMGEHQ